MEKFFTKKNILNILLLGIMVLAIPLSINLIKKQQILKSGAAGNQPKAEFVVGGCVQRDPLNSNAFIATCPTLGLVLTSPYGSSSTGNQESQCWISGGSNQTGADQFCISRYPGASVANCRQFGVGANSNNNDGCFIGSGGVSGGGTTGPSCPAGVAISQCWNDGGKACQSTVLADQWCTIQSNHTGDSKCAQAHNVSNANTFPDGCTTPGNTISTFFPKGGLVSKAYAQEECVNDSDYTEFFGCDPGGCGYEQWKCTDSQGERHLKSFYEDNGHGCSGSNNSACQSAPPGGAGTCTPDGSCSAAEPACDQTTTGVDNCGTACTKNGPSCAAGGGTGGVPVGTGGCCTTSANCNADNIYNGQPTNGWTCTDTNPNCQGGSACKAPSTTGGVAVGTGGCCTTSANCNASNLYNGQSTAGWTCTDTNPNCQGGSACKAPSSPTALTTLGFKISETNNFVNSTLLNAGFDQNGQAIYNYNLQDQTPGQKVISVQFTGSDNTIKSAPAIPIKYAGAAPVIAGCTPDLNLTDGSLTFTVASTGQNFGAQTSSSKLQADSSNLEIINWAPDGSSVQAKLANPSNTAAGHPYNITLIRQDGVTANFPGCTVGVSQIKLGANWLCQNPTKLDMSNVDLSVFQMAGVGATAPVSSQAREKVTVSGGIISNIKTKIKQGAQYVVCLKALHSLRLCTNPFPAQSTNDLSASTPFNIPFGDLNDDGAINSADASRLKQQWGKVTSGKNCDFNSDGICNSFEYSCMLRYFNKSDSPEPQ